MAYTLKKKNTSGKRNSHLNKLLPLKSSLGPAIKSIPNFNNK